MKPIEDDTDAEPLRQVIANVRPEAADLKSPSIAKFFKLGQDLDLVIQVQATRVAVSETLYARTNKNQAGMVKKPAFEIECVQVLMTNGLDFAVTASWEGKTFTGALIGGKRSGHTSPRYYKLITPALTKITDSFIEQEPNA